MLRRKGARIIGTELYLPFSAARKFYSKSHYSYQAYDREIFVDNNPITSFDQNYHFLAQGLGFNYTDAGIVELGVFAEDGFFDNELLLDKKLSYQNLGVYALVGYDSLNDISFPTSGRRITIRIGGQHETIENAIDQQDFLGHRETDSFFVEFDFFRWGGGFLFWGA